MQKKRFRQSKIAIIIDAFLMPVMIPYACMMQGIPATCREVVGYFNLTRFKEMWSTNNGQPRGWLKG